MKKYLCLFVSCLFFGLSEIDALTWVKSKYNVCTETEEYIRWKKLPDSKKDNYFMPIRCEEFLKRDKSITSTSLGNPFNVDYKTAKKFSLLEQNKLTPVKDQGSSGLCWTFTTNAVVESSYLVEQNQSLDLSEKHLDYNSLRTLDDGTNNEFGFSSRTKNQGGQFLMSGAYLASGRGPVLETKLPWSNTTANKSNTLNQKADYYVSDVDFLFSSTCSNDAILKIKEKLVNYGAVGARIYDEISSKYLSSDKSSYYYYGTEGVNHAITIVGWDDDYSASNFVKTPAGNGAWLVKDSYLNLFGGSNGLPKGYAYVSYYDNHLCSFNMSAYNITNKISDNLYTYAKLGYNEALSIGSSTMYFKNIYMRKSSQEQLNKISLYLGTGDKYELYYSETDDFNSATLIGSGAGTKDGYTTVNLSSPVKINSEKFYVYVKYTSSYVSNSKYYYPAARVDSSSTIDDLIYYRVSNLSKGVSFYSGDASSWTDTTSNSSIEFYFPINVFTDNVKESPGISIASTEKSSEFINTTDGGYLKYNLKLSVISLDDVKVNIYNNIGNDVTNLFDISKLDTGYKVELTSKVIMGSYTIKFTYGDIVAQDSFSILVKARDTVYVKSIEIVGSDEVSVGGTLNLKVNILPENADTKDVTWSSSNPFFATVDENGIVKGYAEGSVTISATSIDGTNVSAYKLIKIIDINKEEGNGETVINNPVGDKSTNNPDTGFSDATTILLISTLVGLIIFMYTKKYNLFKKF